MDTKFMNNEKSSFVFVRRERHGLNPFMIFPSVYTEHRDQGLAVSLRRITLAWGRRRWHVYVGKRHDPMFADIGQAIGPAFIKWASAWAKQPVDRHEFLKFLSSQPEWREVVKWGGSGWHYSRILLVREYLVHRSRQEQPTSNTPVSPKGQIGMNSFPQEEEEIGLELTWDDGTTATGYQHPARPASSGSPKISETPEDQFEDQDVVDFFSPRPASPDFSIQEPALSLDNNNLGDDNSRGQQGIEDPRIPSRSLQERENDPYSSEGSS